MSHKLAQKCIEDVLCTHQYFSFELGDVGRNLAPNFAVRACPGSFGPGFDDGAASLSSSDCFA